jgi:PncC family amidohydrolase
MIDKLITDIIEICSAKGLTIGLAESCTGGLISEMITSISGSSKVFKGAIISYSNDIKESLLNVSKITLIVHGAVSKETAIEMVLGCKETIMADICLSVTGIAGPTGGTSEKPVGLVYIAIIVDNQKPLINKYIFKGDRAEIRKQSADEAIKLIHEAINN